MMQMKNFVRRQVSFLHTETKRGVGLALTILIMAALIAAVYLFDIPNPNMVLIAGLVICSATFGYTGGITAGIIMLGYTLFFFSTGNDFLTFSEQNLKKVFVSLFGIVADMLFVCELKRREIAAFRKVRKLTDELSRDNMLLKEASHTDALTGMRNRYALRQDFHQYLSQYVFVAMIDVDNFKLVNDRFGHERGDQALKQTGALFMELFGKQNAYRYGGDEFLIIYPTTDEKEFMEKLRLLNEKAPVLKADGETMQIRYSVGFVQGNVREDADLREMFAISDERMYEAKRTGWPFKKGGKA